MQRLIVDKLTGTILDADHVVLIEADTDDLDLIEAIVNNWSAEAAEAAAHDLGWKVTAL